MSTPVTVDITDVVPAARRIDVAEIKVGDKVFDTFGRTYDLVDVKTGKNGQRYIKRIDNPSYWDCIGTPGTDTITAIPASTQEV